MPRRRLSALIAAMGLWLAYGTALAQSPSRAEAQAIWDAFWGRLAAGDLDGARRYLHTTRQGAPWMVGGTQLQHMARQMRYCRIASDPLPDSAEDVLFEVRCEHAGQTATTLVGFRQDVDGAWRLTVL
jgi:hypothetical protein